MEFDVAKRTVAATRLAEGDRLLLAEPADAMEYVVLQSRKGFFIRFLKEESPEKKKTAIGVRAMRLGEEQEVKELYAALGRSMKRLHGFRYYFLSADADFERKFGRQADKKRKLYNGNIKCTFYQYFKDFSRQTR